MRKIQFKGILFLLLLLITSNIFCQDLLYKKDATVLEVVIKDFNGKTIKYQLSDDSSGKTFYMSKSVVDSIVYSDNKTLDLTLSSGIVEIQAKQNKRNNLSLEIVNSFSGKPTVEYEKLSEGGRISYVARLMINFESNPADYWYKHPAGFDFYNYDPFYFFISGGVNYYPFHNSLIRNGITNFSTGCSLFLGSYRRKDYSNYINDQYPTDIVPAAGLMWHIKEHLYLGDYFQLTGGLVISIVPFLTFACPQLGLTICF